MLYTLLNKEGTVNTEILIKIFENELKHYYPTNQSYFFKIYETPKGKKRIFIPKLLIKNFIAQHKQALLSAGINEIYLDTLLNQPEELKNQKNLINLSFLLGQLKGKKFYKLSAQERNLFTTTLATREKNPFFPAQPLVFYIKSYSSDSFSLYLYKEDVLDFLYQFKEELSLSDKRLLEWDNSVVFVDDFLKIINAPASFLVKLYKALSPEERKTLFEYRKNDVIQKKLCLKTNTFVDLINNRRNFLLSLGMPHKIIIPMRQWRLISQEKAPRKKPLVQKQILTEDKLISLKQIFYTLARKKFDLSTLEKQEPYILADRVFDEKTNTLRPLIIKRKHSNGQYILFISRLDIPLFFERWGKTFNFSDYHINTLINSKNLDELDKNDIILSDFCQQTKTPLSFSFWLKEHLTDLFKEDQNLFSYKRDEIMRCHFCIESDNLKIFVQKHKNLLVKHGLTKKALHLIFKDQENPNEKIQLKHLESSSFLRMDTLILILKKTTTFIPKLTNFIQNNCLDDTFMLPLSDGNEIKCPLFSNIKIHKKKSTIYFYKEALPIFLQKYQDELIQLGIRPNTLEALYQQYNIPQNDYSTYVTADELYHLTQKTTPYETFLNIIQSSPLQTFTTKEGKEKRVLIQTPIVREPLFINKESVLPLLLKHQKELSLSDKALFRIQLLLNQNKEEETTSFYQLLKAHHIRPIYFNTIKKNCALPYLEDVLSLQEADGSIKKQVLFSYKKEKGGHWHLHLHNGAIEIFMHSFKDILKTYSNNPSVFDKWDDSKKTPLLIQKNEISKPTDQTQRQNTDT